MLCYVYILFSLLMYRVWSYLIFGVLLWWLSLTVSAQVSLPEDDFYIIPEAKGGMSGAADHVKWVLDCTAQWPTGGVGYTSVWECYNKQRKKIDEWWGNVLGYQLATGIISREWVLFYIAYLIRFLVQLGIVAGAVMIIYTGYKYALSAINGTAPWRLSDTLTNIGLWLFLITASYGILKLITTMFL